MFVEISEFEAPVVVQVSALQAGDEVEQAKVLTEAHLPSSEMETSKRQRMEEWPTQGEVFNL